MALSEAQKKAVTHREGPAIVLAGPGSGKTTVITHRADYLIRCGILPIHILVVTFTRAAAAQMQSRFLELRQEERTQVRFGTFHSLFYEILKQAYHLSSANIASEEQRLGILKEALPPDGLEAEDETELLHDLAQEISLVKNDRIDLQHYYAVSVSEGLFRDIFRRYQKRMEEKGLLDYDDLMCCTWELFRERPDILKGWQRRFTHILIDEFQDINGIQYDILKLLAAPENNLFVVGDDDQSIYRFRGAKPEIMLNFPKEFPSAKKIVLDLNYRCPGHVIELSQRVIQRNTVRYQKQIRQVKEDGCEVEKLLFQNPAQESLGIIRRLDEETKKGRSLGEIAVLYRSNMDAGVLTQKLLEYNIPFRMRDVVPNLFTHWIAGDICAYLRIASGSRSRADFLRIVNRPVRYIERGCLDTPQVSLERLRMYYEEKYWMVQRIDKLERDLAALARMEPAMAVSYIRHGIGYEEYLTDYAQKRRIREEDLLEVLDRLEESARGYRTHAQWFAYMEEYAQMLKEQARGQAGAENAVTLTTLHSAKGLEFPVVFLIDVNDGIIPSKKARLLSDVEEERRLFYVGITRASEKLILCSLKEKYGKSLSPSPFLN